MIGAGLLLMACASGDGSDDDEETGGPVDTGIEGIDDTGPDDTDDSGPDTDTEDPDTGWGTDDEIYASLFDATIVQRFDLELSEKAIEALRATPDEYVEGAFEHDGHRLEEVGIRLKGGSSTFEDIDGKPSFKIAFGEFDGGQDYGGVERLNFHNMNADPALGREVLASALWNAAGLAAPLATYAEVYVNGESWGLYANVEAIDGDFAERRWAIPDGDLWQGDDDADFTPSGVDHFAEVAGEGDLDALDAARRQIQLGEGDSFYAVGDVVIDMSQFLDFWSWQILLANEDGYPYELDDYYVYANPEDGDRYEFVPAGLDETWDTGFEWEAYTGTLAVQCAHDEACLATLKEHAAAAANTYEGLAVSTMATDLFTLSTSVGLADTRRSTAWSDVLNARTAFTTQVAGRPASVRAQLGL